MDWISVVQSLLVAVVTAIVVSLINHYLTTAQRKKNEIREMKRKAYSELLDSSRAFLDDPNLSKDERRAIKKKFLEKYYNEIILFADTDVQNGIEDFVKTGGVSSTNPGSQVSKLKNMIISIRKDLEFEDSVSEDFKMYSLDIGEERD